MVYIKKGAHLPESSSKEFNQEYGPKEYVFYGGIYHCLICHLEIFQKEDSYLPPKDKKDNHSHKWQLLISMQEPIPIVEKP